MLIVRQLVKEILAFKSIQKSCGWKIVRDYYFPTKMYVTIAF